MGKDYIYISQNGLSLELAYKLLFSGRYGIKEASEEKYFQRIPFLNEIEEIELGDKEQGTNESILRLNDGGFCVVNKTIPINSLK